jgi:hypothetical protein
MKNKKFKKGLPKNDHSNKFQKPKELVKGNGYYYIVGLAIIILLGTIIYSNSFNCPFQFDDILKIVNNPNIRNLSDVSACWKGNSSRPIAMLTFALNYHFNQLDVWYYHLMNLFIHLINTCLVWWLTLLIFSSPNLKNQSIIKHKKAIAFVTALLFVTHPLATESVTYIVQRMASLACLFYFLSLSLYVYARLTDKSKTLKYLLFAGSFVSAVLAMLSKENAFTLPFAIMLFEIFFLRTKRLSINYKDYRFILLMAAFIGFILIVLLKYSSNIFKPIPPDLTNDYRTVTSLNYLFTQFSVIVKYIQLLFLPINQNFDYDFPISHTIFEPRTLISFFFILSLIALAIFLFKRGRIISFGIFWFFLTLSIESSFIPISDLIFEHRTYLPSYGFFLILSSGIYVLFWNKYKYIAISILVIIIGSNSFLTYERNKVWKDEFIFWNDVLLKSPQKARPHFNRGNSFNRLKKYKQALDEYNKAIELKPNFIDAYNNRGTVFININRNDDALNDFNKVIELNPKYFGAYFNRGGILFDQKKYEDAINNYSMVIILKPDYADAYYNRGLAEYYFDKKDNACMDLQKAFSLGFQPANDFINQYCH